MATLVLGAVGAKVGGMFGGPILGMSGAAIGGALGSIAGSAADSWLMARLSPRQRIEAQRLDGLHITTATEGMAIPRVHGRMRMGGNIIWATDYRQEISERRQRVSKFQRVTIEESAVFVSFAVAICEGPITGIGRVWADGEPMDFEEVTWRWYPGDQTQEADPAILAAMGPDAAPAYRGTAYAVFEDLEVTPFGTRIPQLSFEVIRPLAEPESMEGALRAVTMIPGAGEFAYAAEEVRAPESGGVLPPPPIPSPGDPEPPALPGFDSDAGAAPHRENDHAREGIADLVVSLDQLVASGPAVESVSLVVSWFGDDLRAGDCTIRPKVDQAEKTTQPPWGVNGLTRTEAELVSQSGGVPVYGGTPADFSVVQAIQEMKARGLRVTFYPFIMMDVPEGNTLPDPYSDNAAGVGQPALPWRGRITCSPAAGFDGTVDKTSGAAAQVAAFFGAAAPSDFDVDGTTVSWTGGSDWGLRRMVLHYAHLCAAAGGVDAFLIGTEMRGLTWIRDGASSYPAVQAFRDLAADVRAILGSGTKISYAADWSEYFGHQPGDGTGDVHFHLDPLWADANVDFIGIDNYMPLSDWRDGFDHLDAQAGWPAVQDRAYLQANIAGGEGFDWFYASDADRASQTRTPITDGAHGKPWVFRFKDLRAWWSNAHIDRPGGVETGGPTPWVPQSKPIWFTEFGCPAVDRGTNQPNVFFDPKSSESFVPYFSRGWHDDAIQRAYLEAMAGFWQDPANNPTSGVYGTPMVTWAECAAWTWDARPYPQFPALEDVWVDGTNWRLGHWLTGRLGSAGLPALVRALCRRAGLEDALIDVSGLWGAVEGFAVPQVESPRASIAQLGRAFGFDAVETGGVIRFVMRGRAPAARVALDDSAAPPGAGLPLYEPVRAQGGDGGGAAELHEMTRGQESELPASLRWTVARSDNERYETAAVEASRATARHARIAAESFPFAMPPEEAERLCRRALAEAWTGREALSLQLPPSALALDPGDAILAGIAGHALEFRALSISDAEARALEAVRQDREDRDIGPALGRAARLSRPLALGAPAVAILDLPLIYDGHEAHRPLIAASARPWPGEMAVYGAPVFGPGDPATWELRRTFTHRAAIGRLIEDLPGARPSLWQRNGAALVEMLTGTLASAPDLQVLAGENLLALQAVGGWELLQFQAAELIAPQTWRLTRLLRGQRGTEWAIADPAPAGASVVLMDPEIPDLPTVLTELGEALPLRIGPASRPLTDPSYAAGSVTPEAVGLRPFAPVHLRARREGDDLRLSWIRRDRALEADSWYPVEVPQSETAEEYTAQILDGPTVLRSLSAGTSSVLYTATQQSADWGAPLDPGDPLTFRVTQLSALMGPGYPATAEVTA